MSFFSFLFPNLSESYLKSKEKTLKAINSFEPEMKKLSQEEIILRIGKIKKEILEKNSFSENNIIQTFALTREAAVRTLGQRHFDVQIFGGLALAEGKIIEMKTGEGKTLVATLPATLNSLFEKGVHIITVNDYLAKRDTVWMGQIYHYLGLEVGCITQEGAFVYDPTYKLENLKEKGEIDKKRDQLGSFKVFKEFLRPVEKRKAYLADITYGTNAEFGFDYLRDHLVDDLKDKVQREHFYTIIDEVDSILIDEARTPLIISIPDEEASSLYQQFAQLAKELKEGRDFVADDKDKSISLTEEGLNNLEKIFRFNIFDEKGWILVHYLENALKAHRHYLKDRDYIVKDGKVIIVDEFTGRLLPDRRFSGGLHQALEAKERVEIQKESRTVATITFQNYFRMYKKLAGMTGTAFTSQEEFKKVYNLEVIIIPTNKPMIRVDLPDRIYKTKEAKLKAIAKEVYQRNQKGQPILIGTPSVEKNEELAKYLKRLNLNFEILNAKNHEREGEIIAQAGRFKAITVATNLAGRGVDIILGGNPPLKEEKEKVLEAGGLFVIGTERHEARRIDNQLRGRAGRQGDIGSSQFFLSLEDDLVKIFAPPYLKNFMDKMGWPDEEPLEHPLVSKAIESAQQKIEGYYFDIRRHVLEYDDVINKQRIAFYNLRDSILKDFSEGNLEERVKEVFRELEEEFPNNLYEEKINQGIPKENLLNIFKVFALNILDTMWVSHLEKLESLRDSTALRAYGGHDPLIEYKKESYLFYKDLEDKFKQFWVENIKKILSAEIKK
ncbi:MAG TPA: preprotein translocase subunit SecA [Candidatus Paceibacterota bacterium]|nr:preprotein translocase subunit SecA [Candidatus Paceibacterota bacterium]